MGGGASTPVNLTKADLEAICKDEDAERVEKIWTAFRGPDDSIDGTHFFHVADDECEKEAFSLFLCFGNGEIDKGIFVEFCVYSKLLSKKKFDRSRAEAVFDEYSPEGKPLNYMIVRFEIIPIIANACGKYTRDIVRKLSHTQEPLDLDEYYQDRQTSGCSSKNISEKDSPEDAIARAVVRIQSMLRMRRALKELQKQKELKRLEDIAQAEERAAAEFQEHLDKCERVFLEFSPSGAMNMRDFIRLCFDSELIPFGSKVVDFTSGDAKHIFKKVVAMYFDPSERIYKNGVICGKKFVFKVFRERVIGELALAKHVSVEQMALFISTCSGVRRGFHGERPDGGGPVALMKLSSEYLDKQIDSSSYEKYVTHE